MLDFSHSLTPKTEIEQIKRSVWRPDPSARHQNSKDTLQKMYPYTWIQRCIQNTVVYYKIPLSPLHRNDANICLDLNLLSFLASQNVCLHINTPCNCCFWALRSARSAPFCGLRRHTARNWPKNFKTWQEVLHSKYQVSRSENKRNGPKRAIRKIWNIALLKSFVLQTVWKKYCKKKIKRLSSQWNQNLMSTPWY